MQFRDLHTLPCSFKNDAALSRRRLKKFYKTEKTIHLLLLLLLGAPRWSSVCVECDDKLQLLIRMWVVSRGECGYKVFCASPFSSAKQFCFKLHPPIAANLNGHTFLVQSVLSLTVDELNPMKTWHSNPNCILINNH
jgi:hypothetical protein